MRWHRMVRVQSQMPIIDYITSLCETMCSIIEVESCFRKQRHSDPSRESSNAVGLCAAALGKATRSDGIQEWIQWLPHVLKRPIGGHIQWEDCFMSAELFLISKFPSQWVEVELFTLLLGRVECPSAYPCRRFALRPQVIDCSMIESPSCASVAKDSRSLRNNVESQPSRVAARAR